MTSGYGLFTGTVGLFGTSGWAVYERIQKNDARTELQELLDRRADGENLSPDEERRARQGVRENPDAAISTEMRLWSKKKTKKAKDFHKFAEEQTGVMPPQEAIEDAVTPGTSTNKEVKSRRDSALESARQSEYQTAQHSRSGSRRDSNPSSGPHDVFHAHFQSLINRGVIASPKDKPGTEAHTNWVRKHAHMIVEALQTFPHSSEDEEDEDDPNSKKPSTRKSAPRAMTRFKRQDDDDDDDPPPGQSKASSVPFRHQKRGAGRGLFIN